MRAIFIYLLVILHLIILSPLILFNYFKYEVKGKSRDYEKIYKLPNFVFNSVLKMGQIKYKVIGMENLDNIDNGFLIVANHQSYFDIPILSLALKTRGVSFISKEDILKVPLISHYMKVMNCLFLDRESVKSGMQMIKNGGALLKEGANLVIFPEGTRSKNGVMRDFKTGSLKLATRVKSPIVPISISKSYDLHTSSFKMNKGEVTVLIHPPVCFNDYENMSGKELNDMIESTVKNKVEL